MIQYRASLFYSCNKSVIIVPVSNFFSFTNAGNGNPAFLFDLEQAIFCSRILYEQHPRFFSSRWLSFSRIWSGNSGKSWISLSLVSAARAMCWNALNIFGNIWIHVSFTIGPLRCWCIPLQILRKMAFCSLPHTRFLHVLPKQPFLIHCPICYQVRRMENARDRGD